MVARVVWSIAALLLLSSVPVHAQSSEPTSEPTATAKSDPLEDWTPIPLTYFVHNKGECPTTGDTPYFLNQEDTAGDMECGEMLGTPMVTESPTRPPSEGTFIIPAKAPIPVMVPEGAAGTFLLYLKPTTKPFMGTSYNPVPFKLTIGAGICEGNARRDYRYSPDGVATLRGTCAFVGKAKITDKASLEFTIKSTETPITIKMEGGYSSQFIVGVLLNPLPTQAPVPLPIAPRGDASWMGAPLALAVCAALVASVRSRR